MEYKKILINKLLIVFLMMLMISAIVMSSRSDDIYQYDIEYQPYNQNMKFKYIFISILNPEVLDINEMSSNFEIYIDIE